MLFFGAASKINPIVQATEQAPALTEVLLDRRDLCALDTTGLAGLEQIFNAVPLRRRVLRMLHAREHARAYGALGVQRPPGGAGAR